MDEGIGEGGVRWVKLTIRRGGGVLLLIFWGEGVIMVGMRHPYFFCFLFGDGGKGAGAQNYEEGEGGLKYIKLTSTYLFLRISVDRVH